MTYPLRFASKNTVITVAIRLIKSDENMKIGELFPEKEYVKIAAKFLL